MPKSFLTGLFLVVLAVATAQSPRPLSKSSTEDFCRTTPYTDSLSKLDKRWSINIFEETIRKHIISASQQRTSEEEIFRIPVIFHVIHQAEPMGSGGNISQKQVASQIMALNDDFRRRGLGYNEHEDGADIKIEFYLASLDPYGRMLEEPGIDRVEMHEKVWSINKMELYLKPKTYWNPYRYLNIWTVNFDRRILGFTGYAQFPIMSGLEGMDDSDSFNQVESTDGILINSNHVGTLGTATAPYNLGRVITHEVGHYLGLRHIWGDGDCSADDFCDDTPNAAGPNNTCEENVSCGSRDMIENYMDYTPDACNNIFTKDQKNRMRTVLAASPRRKELVKPESNCANAVQITETGVQTANETINFYQYTSSDHQELTISSLGLTTEDTHLDIWDRCDGKLLYTNDNIGNSLQSLIDLSLAKDDTIIIVWSNLKNATSFQWELQPKTQENGSICEQALSINEGEHPITTTNNSVWYQWTCKDAREKLMIKAENAQITVFDDCENAAPKATGYDQIEAVNLTKNQTYYILIAGAIPESIHLSTASYNGGETCMEPKNINLGTNTFNGTSEWFIYSTPDANGQLSLSGNTGDNHQLNLYSVEVEIYKACDDQPIKSSFNGGLWLDVSANTSYLIKWTDLSDITSGFDWELSFEEKSNGTNCHSAIEAIEGVNTYTSSENQESVWFSYVTPDHPSKMVFEFNEGSDLKRFSLYQDNDNDCSNATYIYIIAEYPWNDSPIFEPNQTIYFEWDTNNKSVHLDWDIYVLELEEGDLCSIPYSSTEGINQSPGSFMNCWTEFTMPRSGDFSISSIGLTDKDTYLEWYAACDNAIIDFSDDADDTKQSKLNFTGVSEGEKFFFHWNNKFDNVPIQWEIKIEENNVKGALCSNPISTTLGETTYEGQSGRWYEITIPKNGDLLISSKDLTSVDTYLQVYNGCADDIIAENDDISTQSFNFQSELIIPDLSEGEKLLIFWSKKWNEESFQWKMELMHEEVPLVVENQIFEISELSEIGTAVGTIVAQAPDETDLLFEITSGNENGHFSLDENTGALTLNHTLDYETQATYAFEIAVSNHSSTVSSVITINIIDEEELGLKRDLGFKFYPNPAADHIIVENPNSKTVEIRILDMVGKLVVSHKTTKTSRISISNLPSGVYLIEFHQNQQIQKQKLILK